MRGLHPHSGATLTLLLLAGCGSDPAPEALTPESFCAESSRARCEFFYRCFSKISLEQLEGVKGFNGVAGCGPVFEGECTRDLVAGVNAGRQSFVPQAARACVAALPDVECVSLAAYVENGEDVANCAAATDGLRAPRDACLSVHDCSPSFAQCRDGFCTESLSGDSFDIECNQETAPACPGLFCIGLPENVQQRDGICTAQCATSRECGPGATCYNMAGLVGQVCLKDCAVSEDCGDGFVCVMAAADGRTACFVER